jgi:hypothetical protein
MERPIVILKPCPFCGDKAQVETIGTCIEIYCCSSMELQKSDVLTIEDRETWDNTKHIYGKQAELKALESIAEDWNKRI